MVQSTIHHAELTLIINTSCPVPILVKPVQTKCLKRRKKKEKGNITSFNSKVEIVGRNWFNGWFKIIISGTMTWTLFLLMWTTKARQIILEAYLLFPPTDWRKKNRCWSHNNHILSVGLETGRLLPMLCIRITHIPQMVAFEHLLNISPFCLLFNTDNGIILRSLTFFFEHILRWNCFFLILCFWNWTVCKDCFALSEVIPDFCRAWPFSSRSLKPFAFWNWNVSAFKQVQ